MALAADEERALARIEEELCRSDPRLAAKLSMFNRLTRSEAMPERELLTPPGRLRRFCRRAGLWTARWRLYPPVPPRAPRPSLPSPGPRSSLSYHPTAGRHRWPSRLAAILPVIATVCALGVVVAIFSALGHVDGGAARAPASSCHAVTLTGCHSAAHAKPKP